MTEFTPNYNLWLFDNAGDESSETVADFRAAFSGDFPFTSNMQIIDTSLGDLQDQVDTLVAQKGFIKVYANELTTNVYIADGVIGLDSYTTNVSILLAIDVSNTGTTTLNINSLGTLSLMKFNSSATAINLNSGDLIKERFYVFTYDGTRWVWDNAFSSDQINVVSGVSGNFLRTASGGNVEDSGSSPSTFAVTAKGVTNGDSHDHSGGDGAQISYSDLGNLPGYTKYYFNEDFITNIPQGYVMRVSILGTGATPTLIDGENNHSGIISITTGLDGGGGAILSTTLDAITNSTFSLDFVFKIVTAGSGVITRLGFINTDYVVSSETITDGIWLNISNLTLDGRTENNSSSSTTGTSYTISTDVWYRGHIELNSGGTTATYTLYDSPTTTILWTNTLATNIPTARKTNLTFYSYASGGNFSISYLDYIGLMYSQNR